ncbi:MAG: hypothetical protein AB7O74_05400 [Candidatus Nanopelagicales bacterium]
MKSMARLVALLLAAALAGCQFLPWVGERAAVDIPWRSVLSPSSVAADGWIASLGLPLTVVAGIAAVGAIANTRALVVIGGLLGVAVPMAWIVINALDTTGGVPLTAIRFGAYGAAVIGFMLLLVAALAQDAREQNLR